MAPKKESTSQQPLEAEASGSTAGKETGTRYYLLKAEPDSRIVKGKDVKFSVDDFEAIGTSPWEGVRSYEARNIMKEMKLGDKALFYHSNCKQPGIAAFAEVSKEAYPDYTAWDPTHPYFDPKSQSKNPTWYMVDLTLKSRSKHLVPLALLKYIATVQVPKSASKAEDGEDAKVPGLIEEVAYLSREDVLAIQGMDLVTRGRLSVQRVRKAEWDAINLLAERGGWEELDLKRLGSSSGASKASKAPKAPSGAAKAKGKKRAKTDDDDDGDEEQGQADEQAASEKAKPKPAPKAKRARTNEKTENGAEQPGPEPEASAAPGRRSSRRIASQTKAAK